MSAIPEALAPGEAPTTSNLNLLPGQVWRLPDLPDDLRRERINQRTQSDPAICRDQRVHVNDGVTQNLAPVADAGGSYTVANVATRPACSPR